MPRILTAEDALQNPNFYLEVPENGGHCGFISFNRLGEFWSETRAVDFAKHAIAL